MRSSSWQKQAVTTSALVGHLSSATRGVDAVVDLGATLCPSCPTLLKKSDKFMELQVLTPLVMAAFLMQAMLHSKDTIPLWTT